MNAPNSPDSSAWMSREESSVVVQRAIHENKAFLFHGFNRHYIAGESEQTDARRNLIIETRFSRGRFRCSFTSSTVRKYTKLPQCFDKNRVVATVSGLVPRVLESPCQTLRDGAARRSDFGQVFRNSTWSIKRFFRCKNRLLLFVWV